MLEHEFRALFDPHGMIVSCKLLIDNKTGRSLGYGFVKFSNEGEAQSAINALNGMQIGNKRLKVAISRPASEDIKNCKLYVTNLPPTHDKAAVEAMFEQYGEIIECRMLMDPTTGQSKCTAFVQMSNRKEAQNAIDGVNQDMLPGCTKPVYVKFSQDHAKKRRVQEAGMMTMAQGAGMMVPQNYGPMRQKAFNQQRFDPYGAAYSNAAYAQPYMAAAAPMGAAGGVLPAAVSAQIQYAQTQRQVTYQPAAGQQVYNPQQANQIGYQKQR